MRQRRGRDEIVRIGNGTRCAWKWEGEEHGDNGMRRKPQIGETGENIVSVCVRHQTERARAMAPRAESREMRAEIRNEWQERETPPLFSVHYSRHGCASFITERSTVPRAD